MQSSDVDRSLNYIYKNTDLGMRAATTLSEIVYGLLNYLDKNRDAAFLKNYLNKGGECSFIECSNEAADSIERQMKQQGICFVSSGTTTMEGKRIIVFADKDAQDVSKIVNRYRCDHNRGGIVTKEQLSEMSRGSLLKVTGLDKYDAAMMTEISKEQGISCSVESGKGDSYNVIFNSAERTQVNSIKMTLALQKAHYNAYEGYKSQYDYEENLSKEFSEKAAMHNTNVPLYLADIEGNTMVITADKVTYTEYGGAETVVDYADRNRDTTVMQLVSSMDNPRPLSREQYQEYIHSDLAGKKEIVIDADKRCGRPEFTQAQIEEIKEMEENHSLYEQKLAMDNPEQEVYNYSYLNNDMRMATFQEYEEINREAVHDKKELRETDVPEIYDDARSFYRGMRDELESVPIEEEQYADAVISNDLDEMEKLDETFEKDDFAVEMMNDLDANMIPDDRQS